MSTLRFCPHGGTTVSGDLLIPDDHFHRRVPVFVGCTHGGYLGVWGTSVVTDRSAAQAGRRIPSAGWVDDYRTFWTQEDNSRNDEPDALNDLFSM